MQFTLERVHDRLVRAEDLRTHAVRHDPQPGIAVQARQERADRRCEVRPKRVQADLDPDIHAPASPSSTAGASIARPGAGTCSGGDPADGLEWRPPRAENGRTA